MKRFAVGTALAWLLVAAAPIAAQTVVTYVQSGSGSGVRVIGYPVPLPVDSLEPFDGFRSHASLQARLQSLALDSDDLEAVAVGSTHAQRTIWAYVVSSASDLDREGRAKPAFYLNGTTHAREWGIPEVATATIEHLLAAAGSQGVERYLLDNTRLVIIPVQNLDGFLQTQRYPTRALLGRDPRYPQHWERDGRMRRKNMPGVDENLFTFGDHLGGVDLNRNHPPFWATGSGSSSDPSDLVYHGTAPQSEPEVQAMLAALELGPRARLRLGIDLHSYTQVFFSANVGSSQRFQVQGELISRLIAHHLQVSRSARFPAGRFYQNVPDPAGRGLGTHAEYFAHSLGVPAWTLEIEPGELGGTDYGGTNQGGSGFILPESEVRRVADAWAQTHQVAFYFMAGPPHLAQLRIESDATGTYTQRVEGELELLGDSRVRRYSRQRALRPGETLRIALTFSKPMRRIDAEGEASWWPGIVRGTIHPRVELVDAMGQRTLLATDAGRWQSLDEGAWRYDGDRFVFEATVPPALADGDYRLAVETQDLAGLRLDPEPETVVDWLQGWIGYEGLPGDADSGWRVTVSSAGVEVVDAPALVAEGDRVALRLRRTGETDTALNAALCDPRGADAAASGACQALSVRWDAGDAQDRELAWSVPDDAELQGVRRVAVPVYAWSSPELARQEDEVALDVLDNDRADARVVRLRDGDAIGDALAALEASPAVAGLELVLDGQATYALSRDAASLRVGRDLRVLGNRSRLLADAAAQPAIEVDADAALELVGIDLSAAPGPAQAASGDFIRNHGQLVLRRSRAGDFSGRHLFDNLGALVLEQSWVDQVTLSGSLLRSAGSAEIRSSTLSRLAAHELVASLQQAVRLDAVTVTGAALAGARFSGPALVGRSLFTDPEALAGASTVCSSEVSSQGWNIDVESGCPMGGAGDVSGAVIAATELGLDPLRAGLPPPIAARDAIPADDCTGADQAASPRPQAAAGGAALCDSGALEAGLAPFRGFWIPDRPGHGIDLQTAGDSLFIGWYTYEADGLPTTYFAIAPLRSPVWEAELMSSRRDPQSGAITRFRVGQVRIEFQSDHAARLHWRFDDVGIEGEEGIRAYLFDPQPPRIEITGSWYPPSESGWGASIARQGERTGAVLYYYDAAGRLRWALGTGDAADRVGIELLHHTGFCPDCSAAQNPIRTEPIGSLQLQMLSPERIEIGVGLAFPGPAGGRWDREGIEFRALNAPVDNHRLRAVLAPTER